MNVYFHFKSNGLVAVESAHVSLDLLPPVGTQVYPYQWLTDKEYDDLKAQVDEYNKQFTSVTNENSKIDVGRAQVSEFIMHKDRNGVIIRINALLYGTTVRQ